MYTWCVIKLVSQNPINIHYRRGKIWKNAKIRSHLATELFQDNSSCFFSYLFWVSNRSAFPEVRQEIVRTSLPYKRSFSPICEIAQWSTWSLAPSLPPLLQCRMRAMTDENLCDFSSCQNAELLQQSSKMAIILNWEIKDSELLKQQIHYPEVRPTIYI